jgi:hypothetical protein
MTSDRLLLCQIGFLRKEQRGGQAIAAAGRTIFPAPVDRRPSPN